MDAILKGTKTSSDIIRKESEFFTNLKAYGITKQSPIDLYENHHLNIENDFIYDKYQSEADQNQISFILKSFTAINILRKGNNKNSFENIGHIIMTGSSLKLRISSDLDAKIEDGDFSFATHIYYVTQRLWFRLSKGLGFNNQLPTSLDVVAKAQTLLSNHLNSSVRERFNKLEADIESGTRTIESVQDYYINLRTNVVKPEEIVPENVEERIKFLYDENDVENFKEEQSLLKRKAEELDNLKRELSRLEEQKKLDERARLVEECKNIQKSCAWIHKRNMYFYYGFLTLLFLLAVIVIYAVKSPNDTPISITAFIISLIGFICLIRWKKIKEQIELASFKKLRVFMIQHSIDKVELE